MVVLGPRSVQAPMVLSYTRAVAWMCGCSPSIFGLLLVIAIAIRRSSSGGQGRRGGRLEEAEDRPTAPEHLLDARHAGRAAPGQQQIGREARLDGATVSQADRTSGIERQHPDGGRQVAQPLLDQPEGGR